MQAGVEIPGLHFASTLMVGLPLPNGGRAPYVKDSKVLFRDSLA